MRNVFRDRGISVQIGRRGDGTASKSLPPRGRCRAEGVTEGVKRRLNIEYHCNRGRTPSVSFADSSLSEGAFWYDPPNLSEMRCLCILCRVNTGIPRESMV